MLINANEKPPAYLRAVFKRYQNISITDVSRDENVIDFNQLRCAQILKNARAFNWRKRSEVLQAFKKFTSPTGQHLVDLQDSSENAAEYILAYELDDMPGLFMIPSLLSLDVQEAILSRIFHRDLQNINHKTNVHLHHNVSYPHAAQSFFSFDPAKDNMMRPKDSSVHKPMTVGQFMNKKLRWITLGGQYDWTEKSYPKELPPEFPEDLSGLLNTMFPQTKPEAAIVNLYSPGDTLSLHRDISEDCDKGLISLSIGCDALFVIGLDAEESQGDGRYLVMRIQSGDALYMTDSARYAWHGVPTVIPNTTPDELRHWPDKHSEECQQTDQDLYQPWRGWLASKRINLNVRQMKK